jgi:hypothetical protein
VDKVISDRQLAHLKFYDGLTHQGTFSSPKYLREEFSTQKRLITDDQPLYIYKG